MKKLLSLSLFLLLSILLPAQVIVDSLQLALGNAIVDSIKIKILHNLFEEYKNSSPLLAKQTVERAIRLSEEIRDERLQVISHNQYASLMIAQVHPDSAIALYQNNLHHAETISFQMGQLQALLGLGTCYWRKGDFIIAKEYQQKHLDIATRTNEEASIAASYRFLGTIYSETADYNKATEMFVLASRKYERLGMIVEAAESRDYVAFVQRRLGNYEIAKDYILRSDSLYSRLDYLPGMAWTQYNLGVIYKNTGDLDNALPHVLRGLVIYEQLGDVKRIGYGHYTMGSLLSKKENFTLALDHYQKAIQFSDKVGDSINIAYTYSAIGDNYQQLHQYEKAKEFYLKTLLIANTMNQHLMAQEAYLNLSDIYEKEGDYENAFKSKNHYAILRDSFYTREKREFANEVEARYQNEQKAREIELLSAEKDLQALQLEKRVYERNVLIALAFIILLIATLLFNQFRIKQNANKKLKELDRLKSNFFANISHEFRTPLTLIKGPIQQLTQNSEAKLSSENIKMIQRNTDRVLTLVNQLLDLSKIEGGSLTLEPEEGDLNQFLRAVTSSFNSLAEQHKINYTVQIPADTFWTEFDKDKLEKVVFNLLSNAFKFSDDGASVSVDVTNNQRGVEIQVSDTGNGIPPEKLHLIFDRFYQVDSSVTKDSEGSGIGLALSKNLVELMTGSITVTSEVGRGTFFIVHLPFLEIKTQANEHHVNNESISTERSFATEITAFNFNEVDKRNLPEILLIEDNDDMRRYIKEHLIDSYKVTESVDGRDGLQKACADVPDLIITDLMMPKMDGIELCENLKTDVNTSHIPVIMLTAKAGIDNKLEGLETGADDYLTKPFDSKELLVRIRNLIEQRKRLRELYSNNEVQIDPKRIAVTSVDQKFLNQVLTLLEENFSNPEFGVPEMQDSLAMSKTQLHRKLKALTNEAPGELLRNFRLKRAAQLLSKKADSVTQIAYQVGFNNLSYFAKCFKELYGVAPSGY
jgi:signal transduction histidine kinase/DNA-binding response OmpR family regulator